MNKLKAIPFFSNIDDFLEAHERQIMNRPLSQKEQRYYEALISSFQTFIEEERKGNIFTEERLMEAIKAARTLYK